MECVVVITLRRDLAAAQARARPRRRWRRPWHPPTGSSSGPATPIRRDPWKVLLFY